MSRDKQISEMARVILNSEILCYDCGEGADSYCAEAIAEILHNSGYRKAEDVVRDIFEEIEDIRLEHSYGEIDGNELNVKIFNLKKKYESEGEG